LKCALFDSKWKTDRNDMIFLKCLNFTGICDSRASRVFTALKLQYIQDEVLSVYCQNSSVIFKISLCIKISKKLTNILFLNV